MGVDRLEAEFVLHSHHVTVSALVFRAGHHAVGGGEHLPDHERSTALFARLAEPDLRATLSRCVIEGRKDGIRIRRERRGGATALAEAQPAVAPFERFLPSFDLAPAMALAALVGAPPLPPPPFS